MRGPAKLVASWSRRFRRNRMRRFAGEFPIGPGTLILDVGGTPANWELLDSRPKVVMVNMPRAGEPAPAGFEWVYADGCHLPFPDLSFDIVFSNSVIEHVGSPERQRQFAAEVQGVGRGYFVQTPNFWFPVETHLLTPLVHWLPRSWQRVTVPRWNVWRLVAKPSADQYEFYTRHYLEEVRLLGPDRMRQLFPGSTLHFERVLGVAKSLIAVFHGNG